MANYSRLAKEKEQDRKELQLLGAKLKRLRKNANLTLASLSATAGCSIGYLSQVERGQVSPTISSFKKIAKTLGVDLMYFFNDSKPMNSYVVRKRERAKLSNPTAKVIYELLKPAGLKGLLEPLLIRFKPGAHSETRTYTHEGEECLVIVKGKLEFYLGAETYLLNEGDSIWYPATIGHGWRNPVNEETLAIRVTTPPSF
jgi:transcriptional regulator with XRE-family HTH domain